MLISVGERISISLLAIALDKKKIDAISFTGSQSGIITCSNHSEAKIITVKPKRIIEELKNNKVVIVAGFQGVSIEKEITTLGRGGSDTTAVALAISLCAKCVEFYKDVPGICSEDPKIYKDAKVYDFLSYEEALKIIEIKKAKVLHKRAIYLAKKNHIQLIIRSFKDVLEKNNNYNTIIGKTSLEKQHKSVYEKEGLLT
jgi:aspartate kinase